MTSLTERLRKQCYCLSGRGTECINCEAADELVHQRDVLEHLGCERDEARAERDALLKLTKKLWPEGLIGAVALETAGDVRLCFDSPMYANSFVRRMQIPIDASSKASSLDAAIDVARGKA